MPTTIPKWPRAETRRAGKHAATCAALAAALLLCACVTDMWSQSPAPVVRYGAESGVGNTGAHTVASTDTLWNISQRYRIAMQDLVRANGLTPPYALRSGMRLLLPPPQEYRVREDDSLYTISRLFNISTTELARLNSLSAPYNVRPGQTLRLPAVTPPEPPAPPPARYAESAPSAPAGYAPSATIEAEPLSAPPGQGTEGRLGTLTYPAPSYDSGMPPQPQIQAHALPSPETPWVPPNLREGFSSSAPTAAQQQWPDAPAPRTGGRFEWPVLGRVVSGYGPKAGGEHNDGINIAGTRGLPVRAAEAGTVVYADNELKGFGNLVLVRHPDRWMTAYAHLDAIMVRSGDKVVRGQTLGRLGSTGSVDTPQLHFEVRRGTEALNPEIYLARPGS